MEIRSHHSNYRKISKDKTIKIIIEIWKYWCLIYIYIVKHWTKNINFDNLIIIYNDILKKIIILSIKVLKLIQAETFFV